MYEKSETQRIIRAQRELELAKSRGEVIDREFATFVVTTLLVALKNHMLSLPTKVSAFLLGLTSRAQIHTVLKKHVELALRELSGFDLHNVKRKSARAARKKNGAGAAIAEADDL